MSTNINDPQLLAETETLDYDTETEFNQASLPPRGEYDLKVALANYENGRANIVGPKLNKYGKPAYTIHVDPKIIAPETPWDGFRVSTDYLSTTVIPNIGTSKASDFANKIGFPLQRGMKLNDVPEHFKQVLAGEPSARALLDWEGSIKMTNVETGEAQYVVVYRTMREFPQKMKKIVDAEGNVTGEEPILDAEGNPVFDPIFEHPDTGEEGQGRLKVKKYLPAKAQG